MALSEQETHVLYDYQAQTVRLYSTRPGPINQAIRRLGEDNYEILRRDEHATEIAVPMRLCRGPALLTKKIT